MDVMREVEKAPLWRRKWMALPVVGIVAAVLIGTSSFGKADFVIDKDRVSVAQVERGQFLVQVRGAGVLTSKHNQVIATNVEGRVERIEREAGAEVKQGDILARIANPALYEQLSESRWELEALEKDNRASAVVLHSELAELRVEARNAQSNYDLARMKVEAEQTLVDRGIASRLNFEQTKLSAQQQKERIDSSNARVRMMEERLAAVLDSQQARVRKMNNGLTSVQQQVDDLLVHAPIDGVVQQMSLKLGQNVTKGTEVGRIAPHDNLVAILTRLRNSQETVQRVLRAIGKLDESERQWALEAFLLIAGLRVGLAVPNEGSLPGEQLMILAMQPLDSRQRSAQRLLPV